MIENTGLAFQSSSTRTKFIFPENVFRRILYLGQRLPDQSGDSYIPTHTVTFPPIPADQRRGWQREWGVGWPLRTQAGFQRPREQLCRGQRHGQPEASGGGAATWTETTPGHVFSHLRPRNGLQPEGTRLRGHPAKTQQLHGTHYTRGAEPLASACRQANSEASAVGSGWGRGKVVDCSLILGDRSSLTPVGSSRDLSTWTSNNARYTHTRTLMSLLWSPYRKLPTSVGAFNLRQMLCYPGLKTEQNREVYSLNSSSMNIYEQCREGESWGSLPLRPLHPGGQCGKEFQATPARRPIKVFGNKINRLMRVPFLQNARTTHRIWRENFMHRHPKWPISKVISDLHRWK